MSSDEAQNAKAVRVNIPSRVYLVPCAAFTVGSAIGLVRGGRMASLQFLAENVHRPPTTVQGWYFYNKTKNYKVILGGLKGAGAEGGLLAVAGVGWVGVEWVLERIGWGSVKEIGAGIGVAAVFMAYGRGKTGWQMGMLGLATGAAAKGLSLARAGLGGRTPID